MQASEAFVQHGFGKSGGYSDWFLPSSIELEKLHAVRTIIGGFEDLLWYWSSTVSGTGSRPLGFDGSGALMRPNSVSQVDAWVDWVLVQGNK